MSPSLPQVVIHDCPIAIIIHAGASKLRKRISRFWCFRINKNGDPTSVKVVLWGLLPYPSRLSVPEIILLVVATVEPQRGELDSAAVTLS